jgi:small GTP-binding protein
MTILPNDLKYEILPDDYTQYDLSFKVIVIGDSGVGKSCLTNKATKNIFEEDYNATVGFEFFTFNIKIDKKVIKLQIWDTCGQELYRSLITNFYRNTSLAIIVYAINNEESFKDIDMWLKELRTHASPDVKVFLIGNKIDLENERKITKEQGEEFSKNNCINKFIETSAKNGINAQSTFIEIAHLLYQDFSKFKDDGNSRESAGSINSGENGRRRLANRNRKKGCGC